MQIDVTFPVHGELLPTDSNYLLFGALSHIVPAFHDQNAMVRFGPIGGEFGGKGLIRLTGRSRLRVRLPADKISLVLPLVGQTLQVGEHSLRLAAPTIHPLVPAPQLVARMVTFKNAKDPGRFLEVARWKLGERGIVGEPAIPLITQGPRAGEPQRRIVRIKERRVIAYTLLVSGLTAEESIRLQEQSLGGRTRIGAGFFVPFEPRA